MRSHGNLARIEVAPEERKRFFDETFLDETGAELRALGFTYVSLDLEGYKTGKTDKEPCGKKP